MIGPLWQRYHPTNVFYMRSAHTQGAALDYDSYGSGYLAAHTDTTYQMGRKPVRIETLMGVEYNAPKQDTINFFADGFKVSKTLTRVTFIDLSYEKEPRMKRKENNCPE